MKTNASQIIRQLEVKEAPLNFYTAALNLIPKPGEDKKKIEQTNISNEYFCHSFLKNVPNMLENINFVKMCFICLCC